MAVAVVAAMTAVAPAQATTDDAWTVGTSILHPEALTGHWEMKRPDGSIVGLSIELDTSVAGSGTPPSNVPRTIESTYIFTYVRDGQRVADRYWLKNMGAEVTGKHDRLQMHAVFPDGSVSDVDLTLDPRTSRWRGTYRNADYSGPVVLIRPARSDSTAPIGTWSGSGPYFGSYCVHVAMGDDGRLVAWTDLFKVPTAPQNTGEPPRVFESYGQFYDDATAPQRVDDHWRIDIGNNMGGETVDGSLSIGDAGFSGTARHYGNGVTARGNPALPVSWIRVAGPSCNVSQK